MAGNSQSGQPLGPLGSIMGGDPRFKADARFTIKREDYRKYLEEGGVMEMLTRALTDLLLEEDRPRDPLDYLKCYLLEHKRPESDLCVVRTELIFTRNRLRQSEEKLLDLKKRLSKYEEVEGFTPPSVPPTTATEEK